MSYKPKFIEPMFNEATSGLKWCAGRKRSAIVIVGAPPVVRLITTLLFSLISFKNGVNNSGSCEGLPSSGLRACQCTMAAPALAAPNAASAISFAVTGKCGDMLGVWMAPVTAQVMMTLRDMVKSLGRYRIKCTEYGRAHAFRLSPGLHIMENLSSLSRDLIQRG